MRDAIQIVVEFGEQASALARSASVESARLREAQERLAEVVAEMRVLADEAAEAAAAFRHGPVVVGSDLRPSAQMIALMTGILKRLKELSDTVENTVLSQAAATQSLAVTFGEAVRGGTRITDQIVALVEAIKTALPMAGDKYKGEAELASLTADFHDFVAHLRDRRGNTDAAAPDAPTSRLLRKLPFVI
jgi:hypothetical protein